MFAPAQPSLIKKKKKRTNGSSPDGTPEKAPASPATSEDTPTRAPSGEYPSAAATPPRAPKMVVEDAEADDEVWYAKWWMFCFPDQNLMPKR